MKVLELSGDHYQMGRQHAQQVRDLRPQIVKAMRQRLKSLAAYETDLQPAITELISTWQEVAQPTLAMLRGIAEGLDLKWASFLRYTLASYLENRFQPMPFGDGCTVWAATRSITRGGVPILAKNRDYRPNHPRLACLARARPAQGYSYLYATSAGSPAVFSSGINEVGLAVADAHVTSLDIGPGIARYSAMMDILEHHHSVASALDYMRQVPHIGDGTLVLADAAGELAVFETGYTTCAMLPAQHDFVVSTNHFRSQELYNRYLDLSRSELQGNSQNRHARVTAALELSLGQVDVAWAHALMADHGGGRRPSTLNRRQRAICRHSRIDPPYVTISIAVYLPRARTLFFGNDRPCRAVLRAWPVI
jgi:isopenicillin-N N-acyltransferase-like protein